MTPRDVDELSLCDLAQRACRRDWDAYRHAEQQLDEAVRKHNWQQPVRTSTSSVFVTGRAAPRSDPTPTEVRKAFQFFDQAREAVCDALCNNIQSTLPAMRGVKGGQAITLSAALYYSVRIVSLKESIVRSKEGRFTSVRVLLPRAVTSTPHVEATVVNSHQGLVARARPPLKKRGRAPAVREQVKNKMRRAIAKGELTIESLSKTTEEADAAQYGVSRDTVRKARNELIAELNSQQIATSDK